MSTYEIEHNTTDPSTATNARRCRPDLSTFFSTLSQITPAPDHRPHAVPVPGDVSAAFFSLAEALDMMRREADSAPHPDAQEGTDNADSDTGRDLLTTMIQSLLAQADTPPREVEGVDEEFCDTLERVPKASLKPADTCPICNNPFMEDAYPLVVQLPCHPTHRFDLECVRPWLRLRGTCPLDRIDFAKQLRDKVEAKKKLVEEDEEEEWDDSDFTREVSHITRVFSPPIHPCATTSTYSLTSQVTISTFRYPNHLLLEIKILTSEYPSPLHRTTTMSSPMETLALVFFFLILGLTIMIIMILVKEWTEYQAMQFWPKLRSTRTLDLESGLYLIEEIKELTWRVEQMETDIGRKFQLAGYLSEYHDQPPSP
ncbi:Zinc finger, RING-type [Penicillium expansum]|uniref:Zinc finger, RING-type n=1 Tax=Penicillium expansum TaxID=27334 RepID=A0A0A2K326_PENEN|nr:Zinc finger, RING-type [Penicillium expansum]KGO58830.1 Zinc finger, RING-type [Penicillium expansum]